MTLLGIQRHLYSEWQLGRTYCAFLPVGRGLSVVLLAPNGHLLVYDCGNDGIQDPAKFITGHLRKTHQLPFDFENGSKYQVRKLVISHPHVDHYAGLPSFYGKKARVRVRVLSRRKQLVDESCREMDRKHRSGEAGASEQNLNRSKLLKEMSDEYRHDAKNVDFDISIRSFQVSDKDLEEYYPNDLQKKFNNSSTVLVINSPRMKLLLTGDMETDGWDLLFKNPDFIEAAKGATHILASHHGHKSGWNAELLQKVGRPKVWIVSTKKADEDCESAYAYKDENCASGITLVDGCFRRVLSTKQETVELLDDGIDVRHALSTIDLAMNENQQALFRKRQSTLLGV